MSSMLQGLVSLAADNQICVIHEAMIGCKNLKVHYRMAPKMYIYADERVDHSCSKWRENGQ